MSKKKIYQASAPTRRPSPQIEVQGDPGVGQFQPSSRRQDPVHPSEFRLFPSSHLSVASRILLPQPRGAVMQGLPGVGQAKPVSTLQAEEQPSPFRVLRSSHCSVPPLRPSPPDNKLKKIKRLKKFKNLPANCQPPLRSVDCGTFLIWWQGKF
jgi:hypothetical protein